MLSVSLSLRHASFQMKAKDKQEGVFFIVLLPNLGCDCGVGGHLKEQEPALAI